MGCVAFHTLPSLAQKGFSTQPSPSLLTKKEMIDDTNPRIIKIKRMKKLLSCSMCPPHRSENRRRTNNYKTRKSNNFQFIVK